MGYPLPGIEFRIADPETGTELSQGEIGMIEVRGPNVFKGYWRMPEKTEAEFRKDGFFITGGFNVYPKEIEAEIDAVPGVIESAVIGVPHPDLGEGITAVVVSGDAELDEATLMTWIEGRLAKFKLPKRVLFVDGLPRA